MLRRAMTTGATACLLVAAAAMSAHVDGGIPMSEYAQRKGAQVAINGDSLFVNGYVPRGLAKRDNAFWSNTADDAQTGDGGNGYDNPHGGCGCNSGDRPDAALVVFVAWFLTRRRGTNA